MLACYRIKVCSRGLANLFVPVNAVVVHPLGGIATLL